MQYEIIEIDRFTAETRGRVLTKTQIEYFERDGYLVLKDFISPEICQFLMNEADQLIRQFNPGIIKSIFSSVNPAHAKQEYFLDSGDQIHYFFEEHAFDKNGNLRAEKELCINKIGHALHELNPAFHCFSHLDKIAAVCHDLKIDEPEIVQSMYICKQPQFGGEVICHQDSTYLYVHGKPVTGFWFALEDATLENGCLWAIPGGHRTAVKSRLLRDNQNQISTKIYDDSPWSTDNMRPLEVARGSLILLHGHVPHMSKENKSARSRHAYTLHVKSGLDHFAEDNWLRRANDKSFDRIF